MSRALIFVNGELPNPSRVRSIIQSSDAIIAADAGARHALVLGLTPSVVLGDFDSLTQGEIDALEILNVPMLRFPPAKDETDLELALDYAMRVGHHPILLVGAYGGRLDQSIANLALLAAPESIAADVRADDGQTEAFFTRDQAIIYGQPGDLVSLIPWGAPVVGVSTENLAYPLAAENLDPFRTRGVSNQMLAETAKVSLESGLLLCIHIRKI